MNRIEYLNDRLAKKYISDDDYLIISSLTYSLLQREACDFLDISFEQDSRVRRYVLKKLSYDISRTYSLEHRQLIARLINKLNEKGFGKKESCSSAINFLYDFIPTREKDRILEIFLTSKSSRNRNRAFMRINSRWNKKYQTIIEQVWQTHRDKYCLGIILNHFPISFLFNNYKELLQFTEPWQTSKLFLKLGEINLEIVNELKEIDNISYSYVLAKLDKKLSESEAREFIKNNYTDERIGLLLWSFGQMGLWDIIIEYDKYYVKKRNHIKT